MKKNILCVLFFLFLIHFAQSEPILKYSLRFDEAQAHYVQVQMEVSNWESEKLSVSLPVWAPGSYMVREFAKSVEGFYAMDNKGNNLDFNKTSKSTWEIATKNNSTIKINYRVYAFELSVRTSFIDYDQAFIAGSSVFMYVDKMLNLPSTIEIIPAKQWKQITTSLDNINGNIWMLKASDYDILSDSPIAIGNHKVIPFTAAGIKHEIVMIGEGNYNEEKIKKDIALIVEKETKIFGENPCQRYVFFIHNHNSSGGGLEHLNSCVLQMNRAGYEPESAYNGFLALVAHEYIHLWNVKRLRPKDLLPYDYAVENYTNLLYVAEGFTAYYDDLIVKRCGFVSDENYLNTMAGSFTYVENPGDTIQSVTDASWDAWIKYYRPNENSINTTISYYTKGSLIALVIDLAILNSTDGKKRLDDVMKYMYEEYYKKKNNGFTENDLINAIKTVSGLDMSDFFKNYVHTTKKINYNSYLAMAGLRLINKNEKHTIPYLGVAASVKDGKLMINSLERNSPAWKDGLSANDEIIAIDNIRVGDDLSKAMQGKKVNDKINITISRSGLLKYISVTLVNSPKPSYSLEKMESPAEKQQLIYNKWLEMD